MNKRLKMCQAVGCTINLQEFGKPYNLKRRLCPEHMCADALSKAGSEGLWRFCQQCGKLEPLQRFQGKKRSCMLGLQKRRGMNVTKISDQQQHPTEPLSNLKTPLSCQAGCQLSGLGCQAGCQLSGLSCQAGCQLSGLGCQAGCQLSGLGCRAGCELSGPSSSQDILAPAATVTSCCTNHNNNGSSISMHMQMMPTTAITAVQNPLQHTAADAAQHPAWLPTISSAVQSTSPMMWSCHSGTTMSSPATPAAAAVTSLGDSPGQQALTGCQADMVHLHEDNTPSADDDTACAAVLNTIEEELVLAINITAQQQLSAAAVAANPFAAAGTQPGVTRCASGVAYSTEEEARAAILARLDELTRRFAALQQTLVDEFAADLLAAQQVGFMQPKPVPQQQYSSMLQSTSVQSSSGLLWQV